MTAALFAAVLAPGYIHFTPPDLPEFCRYSHQVRVLEVAKFDAEAGVIVFTVTDTLKGTKGDGQTVRHAIDPKGKGVKPIFDWVKKGNTAVMLTDEGVATNPVGYAVIDGLWYSLDYNVAGKHWTFLRAEPQLSAVYHGDAAKLVPLLKDVIGGKKVDVPTKKPDAVPDRMDRAKEVDDGMKANRGVKK